MADPSNAPAAQQPAKKRKVQEPEDWNLWLLPEVFTWETEIGLHKEKSASFEAAGNSWNITRQMSQDHLKRQLLAFSLTCTALPTFTTTSAHNGLQLRLVLINKLDQQQSVAKGKNFALASGMRCSTVLNLPLEDVTDVNKGWLAEGRVEVKALVRLIQDPTIQPPISAPALTSPNAELDASGDATGRKRDRAGAGLGPPALSLPNINPAASIVSQTLHHLSPWRARLQSHGGPSSAEMWSALTRKVSVEEAQIILEAGLRLLQEEWGNGQGDVHSTVDLLRAMLHLDKDVDRGDALPMSAANGNGQLPASEPMQ